MTQAFDALVDAPTEPRSFPSYPLRAEVISTAAAFRAIEPDLEDLGQELCEENVFYEPWMFSPALDHLGKGQAFAFICLYETGGRQRLCGFFPLVRAKLHAVLPLPMYRLWQHPHCFRCTPLIRTGYAQTCWEALFDWLESRPSFDRLLHVNRLPADGAVGRALQAVLAQRRSLHKVALSHQSAFLRIAKSSDEILRQAMSGSTLGKLRRQQRRLAESGELVFRDIDDEPDLDRVMEDFLRLEASGWKGREGTALSSHAEEEAFFRSAIREAKARHRLSFLTMRLDGKLIAGQSSLLGKTGSFLFKTAYDESYSRYSPGVLLEIEHLRRMHDPSDPQRGKLSWSDSCAAPGDGPVYRCWPERRTILDYRIASGLGLPAVAVTLWPLLRRLYRVLQPSAKRA